MSDGLNQMRASRIAQIMEDFRKLQHHIAQVKAVASEEEKEGEGYKLLRDCAHEGRQILRAPFSATSEPPDGNPDEEKKQLEQVMLDAYSRLFLAQKTYLRATAAMRWINGRNAVLQDGSQTTANTPALQVVTSSLRTELSTITDSKVHADLKATDQQQGKWTAEDPDIQSILRFLASRRPSPPSPSSD